MSTRSYICKEDGGKLIGIYCHFDGYIEHNGVILYQHYKTRGIVDKLIALGDLRSLGTTLNSCDPFSNYEEDAGELAAREVTLDELLDDIFIEYVYVFGKDGEWRVYDDKPGSKYNKYNGELLSQIITDTYTKIPDWSDDGSKRVQ